VHCREAATRNDKVCDMKAASLLYYMVPDMIKSASADAMHCVYMGVTKQMLNLLFDSAYSNLIEYPFYLSAKVGAANKLLSAVKLPHFVQRELVPFDKLSFWKASVYRNFLLNVALPLFAILMKTEYIEHFKLLVIGISLCNSESVSEADLQLAEHFL